MKFDTKTSMGLVFMYPTVILECKTIEKQTNNPKVILSAESEALTCVCSAVGAVQYSCYSASDLQGR